jgi:hypothetical protein
MLEQLPWMELTGISTVGNGSRIVQELADSRVGARIPTRRIAYARLRYGIAAFGHCAIAASLSPPV